MRIVCLQRLASNEVRDSLCLNNINLNLQGIKIKGGERRLLENKGELADMTSGTRGRLVWTLI